MARIEALDDKAAKLFAFATGALPVFAAVLALYGRQLLGYRLSPIGSHVFDACGTQHIAERKHCPEVGSPEGGGRFRYRAAQRFGAFGTFGIGPMTMRLSGPGGGTAMTRRITLRSARGIA
jgi:hypothetical protein